MQLHHGLDFRKRRKYNGSREKGGDAMVVQDETQQRHLARLARLRLMDDNFLSICMSGNIKGAQLIVRIILDDDTIQVQRVETQKEYKNLSEHSFCFDVYAKDAQGREMEIEVQRNSAGGILSN